MPEQGSVALSENPIEGRAVESGHARRLFRYGIAASFVYSTSLGAYAWHEWQAMLAMEPEKFATFLSGVFAPLAFLWLVLGFRQQGDELQNSARALWLQGEELRNSVEQQRQLVAVTREQFEHVRDGLRKSEEVAERQARPKIGVQSNGFTASSDAHTYGFLLENAGATVTSVRLMEGSKSHGEASSWDHRTGLTVNFSFEPGEPLRDRKITLSFNDAHGRDSEIELIFPAVERDGHTMLLAPTMV